MAYATLAQLRTYLNLGTGEFTGDDTILSDFVEKAQAAIDKLTGRTFEWAGAATAKHFDSCRDVSGRTLLLSADTFSITSITNGDGSTIAGTKYKPWPANDLPYRAIRLLPSSGVFWRPASSGDTEDAITVTAKWAYSETADEVIQHCTIRLAAWFYRQRGSQGDSDAVVTSQDGTKIYPSRLPKDITDLLGPYKLRGNSL